MEETNKNENKTATPASTAQATYKPGRGRRQYVSVKWVMNYLQVSRQSVYNYAKRQKWHVYRVGVLGTPRYDAAEIEASIIAQVRK